MAQRPQPQAPKGKGRHRAPAQPSTPVFPIRLAHLVRKLRNRHGRIEAPYALPHTFRQHLAISPLDFVRRLRKEEPRALQTYLRRCEDAWPKIAHGARNADDVTVLSYLMDSTWQAAGWTWHLRVPGLSPLSSRDEEDFRLHVHGSRQPFQASFPDWLAHTAQLIVDRVMVPRNVLPARPLSLAIAVGEGRDMQGGYGAGLFLHETLTCSIHGAWGQAAILVSHFPRDLPTTLGIIAHELAHATQPPSAPAHGHGFIQAARALELPCDNPTAAGLENARRYPYWAYRVADTVGSRPNEPDLHPRRRGLKHATRFNSCLHAVYLPGRQRGGIRFPEKGGSWPEDSL